ncbi:hypothetical protein JMA_22400 [Jeotgalibacillus malaysiensis]|uniref:Uncharacterized protein n=1 Tax=Jeotgalibacillus malaysiensis TaxID=1508404 RepID=A0A0B5AS93_9BACL|nr:hypothetical protein [Jeotgalibacillus malaysiensis]AJD91557.1 hypothetical protein JMA_22400 [Jeotgalibacillus malaysiensis]
MNYCPKCGNDKIKEVGGIEIAYELSVFTGKMLKKEKEGSTLWWKYVCKCGYESSVHAD